MFLLRFRRSWINILKKICEIHLRNVANMLIQTKERSVVVSTKEVKIIFSDLAFVADVLYTSGVVALSYMILATALSLKTVSHFRLVCSCFVQNFCE